MQSTGDSGETGEPQEHQNIEAMFLPEGQCTQTSHLPTSSDAVTQKCHDPDGPLICMYGRFTSPQGDRTKQVRPLFWLMRTELPLESDVVGLQALGTHFEGTTWRWRLHVPRLLRLWARCPLMHNFTTVTAGFRRKLRCPQESLKTRRTC